MFRAIALGGGGVRGGMMVGGLAALEKIQPLVFPDGIYGCSAGAVLATALAYKIPITGIRLMFETGFNLSSVIPSINLTSITSFTTQKALFPMDAFEKAVLTAFDEQGVDLRNAVIGDAPQKLHILASNLTTRRSIFLTGNVPVLSALKASCCLPFVFHPPVIFNNVYVDGGVYAHNIHKVVPPECLVFHISRAEFNITPERLQTMSITDYAATLYEAVRTESQPDNVVWFKNDRISILQQLTDDDKKELFEYGYANVSRFIAKRLPEIVS